ncbi:MAG: caspase family protein [Mycobacteriales bacterium]
MTATLPDPAESRAVLLGTIGAGALPPLPAVGRNLTAVDQLLAPVFGPNRRVCRQPDRGTALAALTWAAAATDLLLVYYAGHALEYDGGLRLTLADTDPDRPETALEYRTVVEDVLVAAGARTVILILDCCHAALAEIERLAGTRTGGAYLMAACARADAGFAPEGAEFTAFTGALVRTLRAGGPPGPVTATALFDAVKEQLATDPGAPVPYQVAAGPSGGAVFAAFAGQPVGSVAPPAAAGARMSWLRARSAALAMAGHPDDAVGVRTQLAFWTAVDGDLAAATRLFAELRRSVPAGHPLRAAVDYHAALVLAEGGDPDAARALLAEALPPLRTAYGADHPWVLDAGAGLGGGHGG